VTTALSLFNCASEKGGALRTIAVVNQKGGCGKTTTAINLAAVYAARGLRTLLVDVDPQAHCAAGLGVPERRVEYSIGDAMLADPSQSVDVTRLLWEVARSLDLAPSTMRMAALEAPEGGLHELPDKDRRLHRVLQHLARHYDRCLIDCPPNIGLLTFNALRAAREALIPVETGYFSLRGAERQWETIQRVIKRIGRPIACHILPTIHNPDSELARDILSALRRQFAGQIIPLEIREHQQLREAASLGQAVIEYAPESSARWDHEALADWLEDHAACPLLEIETFRARMRPVSASGPLSDAPEHRSVDVGAPSSFGSGHPVGAQRSLTGGRVAELVERLRQRTRCAPDRPTGALTQVQGAVPASPGPHAAGTQPASPACADAPCEVAENVPQRMDKPVAAPATSPVGPSEADPSRSFGVCYTSAGVLFVQPAGSGDSRVFVAGDFNAWSSTETPMRHNPDLQVQEVLIPMSAGRHQYRLVIGGQWREDPYNGDRVPNEFGAFNSVLHVPAAPDASGGR